MNFASAAGSGWLKVADARWPYTNATSLSAVSRVETAHASLSISVRTVLLAPGSSGSVMMALARGGSSVRVTPALVVINKVRTAPARAAALPVSLVVTRAADGVSRSTA